LQKLDQPVTPFCAGDVRGFHGKHGGIRVVVELDEKAGRIQSLFSGVNSAVFVNPSGDRKKQAHVAPWLE